MRYSKTGCVVCKGVVDENNALIGNLSKGKCTSVFIA